MLLLYKKKSILKTSKKNRMATPIQATPSKQEIIKCELYGDILCECKLNKIVGFDKRTHALECRGCGIYERAESIGLWDKKGNLIGAICGDCEQEEKKEKRKQNKLKKLEKK